MPCGKAITVCTMALIHEKLYQSTDLAQVDFAAYLQSSVSFLAQLIGINRAQWQFGYMPRILCWTSILPSLAGSL